MYSTLDGDQPLSGRTRQYTQYEREAPEPPPPNDVTLGIPALLGIFFAIVIICGLAFGFGYSFGHHGPKPKPATTSAAPAPVIQTAPPPLEAAAQLSGTTRPVGTAPGPEVSGAAKPSPAAAHAVEEPLPASASLSPAESAALAAASRPATVPSGPPTMVQIAAVMHSADAEALASALRREGYPAVVRTQPDDHFLHVQVGPFPTRDAARSMRARLQANGYTPILKP